MIKRAPIAQDERFNPKRR